MSESSLIRNKLIQAIKENTLLPWEGEKKYLQQDAKAAFLF